MNIFLIYPIGIKHRWNKDNIARGDGGENPMTEGGMNGGEREREV